MSVKPIHVLLPKDGKAIKNLDEYRAIGGLTGLDKARSMDPEDVIAEVEKAHLRGRGGAGFPTVIKWKGVRSDTCAERYVVCNGSEGEPGTYKDRFLLRKNPYYLLEGMLISSYVVGARKAVLGLKGRYKEAHARVAGALQEMIEAGVLEPGQLEVVPGPDDYLFGEERALLEFLDNGFALPRIPPPYVQGLGFGPSRPNPTVVNNIETMSHVAMIMQHGADQFRKNGTEDTPGTMIFTLCGDVKNPGMYELPLGVTLKELIMDIGGGPVAEHPIQAVFSGVANRVITPDQFDTPLDFGSMKSIGSGLGSAGLIVYDQSHCIVKIAAALSGFLARESCGQCMPCKTNTFNITETLLKIDRGEGVLEDLERIELMTKHVTDQTRCFLSNEEQILIGSILDSFSEQLRAHIGKPCFTDKQPIVGKIDDFDEDLGQFRYKE